jgi:hypothetical protein
VRDQGGQWVVERVTDKGAQPLGYHIDRDALLRRLPTYIGAIVPHDALAVLQALPRFHSGNGQVAEPDDAPKAEAEDAD